MNGNIAGNTVLSRQGPAVSNDYYRLINRAPGTKAANGVSYKQRIVGKPYVAKPLPVTNINGFTLVTHKKRGRRSTRRAASRRAGTRRANRR